MTPKNPIPEELQKPTEPGIYVRIFHGRNEPDQDLEDWGFDGPAIGPIEGLQCTYGFLHLIMPNGMTEQQVDQFAKKFLLDPKDWPLEIKQHNDLIVWNGMYFGDMTIFHHPGEKQMDPEHERAIQTMENFKKQYRDLELRIMRELRDKVENSKLTSKHLNEKAIKVNVFDYSELTIIDDRLTFLDNNGDHYSLFAECNLEDLIDILNA